MAKSKSSAPPASASVIKCFFDMVLIAPEKVDEVTKGGIVLPEKARQQLQAEIKWGTIVAKGDGKVSDATGIAQALPFEIGERVGYQLGAYSGGTIEHGGRTLDLVGAANIYCSVPLSE